MAKTDKTDDPGVVADPGDHDRVVSLSIAKDGTPDQHNPEFIGDVESAKAITREQFKQNAVAAVDAEKRSELGLAGTADTTPGPDANIDELKKAHEAAAKAAESKADSLVDSLHKGA